MSPLSLPSGLLPTLHGRGSRRKGGGVWVEQGAVRRVETQGKKKVWEGRLRWRGRGGEKKGERENTRTRGGHYKRGAKKAHVAARGGMQPTRGFPQQASVRRAAMQRSARKGGRKRSERTFSPLLRPPARVSRRAPARGRPTQRRQSGRHPRHPPDRARQGGHRREVFLPFPFPSLPFPSLPFAVAPALLPAAWRGRAAGGRRTAGSRRGWTA